MRRGRHAEPGLGSYFCEMEYASQDSNIVIGVGFLHETATERAASCYPEVNFANIDSDYGLDTAVEPGRHRVRRTRRRSPRGRSGRHRASGTHKRVGIISGLPVLAVLRFTTAFTNAVVDFCPACEDSEIIVCHTRERGRLRQPRRRHSSRWASM